MPEEHEVTVEALIKLLQGLHPGLRLVPNAVRNLAIYDGKTYLGFIDLLKDQQKVEYYSDDEE